MVWKSFLSFSIEFSAKDISSARIVDIGTVKITRMNVFFTA